MFIRTKKTFLHHSPPQPRELHELRKVMKFSPRKVKKNAFITGWPAATYKEKHLTEKKKLAVTPKIWDNYTMIKMTIEQLQEKIAGFEKALATEDMLNPKHPILVEVILSSLVELQSELLDKLENRTR